MFSEKLLLRLKHSFSVTVLTGAGISAESGVPTFRGKDGLWNNYKVEDIATVNAFRNNSKLFWDFYGWRRKLIKDVKPNLGHYALVDIERFFQDFYLITQNVDNLHISAGSKNVIELHGNIMRTKCSECGTPYDETFYEVTKIPLCQKCSALTRPDVVLFGESLNAKLLQRAQEAAAQCEVFFSIGTSSIVEPAASLPYMAKGNGAYLVEINTEKTSLSKNVDEFISGQSGKVLPLLVMMIEKMQS